MVNRRRVANFLRNHPYLLRFPFRIFHLFQSRFSAGVVGIVFNPEGQVLLVEHVFHPQLPWGLPGGWVGRDEAPAIAVEREFAEELEFSVEVSTSILIEKTMRNHLDIAYLCHAGGTIGKVSKELLGYQWYALSQLPPLNSFHYRAIIKAQSTINRANHVYKPE